MIRHIVMWKFQESAEGKSKRENMEYVRSRLLELPDIIPEIKRMEVGFDLLGTAMSYDMVLLSEFDDLDALERYKNHPAHVAVSQYVAKIKEARAVVDCEI